MTTKARRPEEKSEARSRVSLEFLRVLDFETQGFFTEGDCREHAKLDF